MGDEIVFVDGLVEGLWVHPLCDLYAHADQMRAVGLEKGDEWLVEMADTIGGPHWRRIRNITR